MHQNASTYLVGGFHNLQEGKEKHYICQHSTEKFWDCNLLLPIPIILFFCWSNPFIFFFNLKYLYFHQQDMFQTFRILSIIANLCLQMMLLLFGLMKVNTWVCTWLIQFLIPRFLSSPLWWDWKVFLFESTQSFLGMS